MGFKIILAFALVAYASGRDLEIGQNSTEARKIFDEKREASPAVWRQTDKVTVNTTEEEIISRIVVTDNRPDKDGDAQIIEGGEGNQTVTIELKSPTVLRGYDFHIEVFAVPKNGHANVPFVVGNEKVTSKPENIQPPKTIGNDFSTKHPMPISTDVTVNDGKRITRSPEELKTNQTPNHPANTATKQLEDAKKSSVESQVNGEHKHVADMHPSGFNAKAPASETKHLTGIVPGILNKSNDEPTLIPQEFKPKDEKDDHSRHVRDTEKKVQSTTLTPSTIPAKAMKDDDHEIVYPQAHVDKISGNTDKLLIPGEIKHDEHMGVKTNKDSLSTTTSKTTGKPRTSRGAEITTAKTDLKGSTEETDTKHVQKIPHSGHVTVPKEFLEAQSVFTPKTGMDKLNEDGKAESQVPYPMQHRSFAIFKPSSTTQRNDSSESSESSSEEKNQPGSPLHAGSGQQKNEKPLISIQ